MPEVKDVKPAVTKDEEDDEDGTGKGKKKKKQKEDEELKRQKELSEEEKQVRFFSVTFFLLPKVFSSDCAYSIVSSVNVIYICLVKLETLIKIILSSLHINTWPSSSPIMWLLYYIL